MLQRDEWVEKKFRRCPLTSFIIVYFVLAKRDEFIFTYSNTCWECQKHRDGKNTSSYNRAFKIEFKTVSLCFWALHKTICWRIECNCLEWQYFNKATINHKLPSVIMMTNECATRIRSFSAFGTSHWKLIKWASVNVNKSIWLSPQHLCCLPFGGNWVAIDRKSWPIN